MAESRTTWPFPRVITAFDHGTREGTKSEMLANGTIRIVAIWDKNIREWIDVK